MLSFVFGLLLSATVSGQPANDRIGQLKAELLAEIAKERIAHLAKDPDLLLANVAHDYVSVDRGEVTKPTHEQMRARFRDYLIRLSSAPGTTFDPRLSQCPMMGLSRLC